MGNKLKTIVGIIVALVTLILLAVIIHHCTNTSKRGNEDDHILLDLSPGQRGQNSYGNITDQDQINELDAMLDSWNGVLLLNAQRNLEHLCEENPEQPMYMYRLGKCYHHLVELGHASDNHSTMEKGIAFCRRALKLDNHDAEIHKWYAMLVGKRAEMAKDTIKDGISDSIAFRRHTEVALELAPNDESLNFVIGRYMFAVADLSWAERGLANWLYDAGLNATYEDALKYFLKVAELNSNWKENMMYVGKCYNRIGLYVEGIMALQIARKINGSNKDLYARNIDDEIEDEIRKYS